MKTSVRQLLAIALLLMPIGWLHAQENKHAQAMHTAFVEAINGKYPKDIKAKLESFNEDSATVARGEWGCLDGGGLVPKEKIHVVTLSKSKSNVTAAIGPLYIDGHRFSFERVPDDPVLPLRPLLDAFDKQAPYANSYYSYVAGDEQAIFPGVSISWGEHGQSFPLRLDPLMSVRIIGFKDDDGFRSTYLLSWFSEESDDTESRYKFYNAKGIRQKFYDVWGIIYEFHCPKMTSAPQVKPYNEEDYYERVNTSMSVASQLRRNIQNNNPERVAFLEADTLKETIPYSYQRMVENLYDKAETANLNTSYEALIAKVRRMAELSRTANTTEQEAICHTLIKELNAYPFLLSSRQYDELDFNISNVNVSQELDPQIASAHKILETLLNPTEEIDSLSDKELEYLNRNHWKLSHHRQMLRSWFPPQGEYYTGDKHTDYLDVNGDGVKDFQAENTLQGLRPGRYRLSAVVRAVGANSDHSGIFVFSQASGKTHLKEIPDGEYVGGNVWYSALSRINKRLADAPGGGMSTSGVQLDINKATANGGQGYGWNRIYIDDIIVSDGTLTYGVSTCPEITNTHQLGSQAFSACDFIVERIGD